MRRMHPFARNGSICIGVILTGLSFVTPAHAQGTIAQRSVTSGEAAMQSEISDTARKEALLKLLDEVMAVLRDDKPFNPNGAVFGKTMSIETDPGYPGGVYNLRIEALRPANIRFSTGADPLDYSEERMMVLVVPRYFEIFFTDSLPVVDRSLLEKRLDLSDYWIYHGVKRGNDMGPGFAPQDRIHAYRYRANNHASTRVPVDVELDYIDPERNDPDGAQELSRVVIERAYPTLTQEQRKQKREEKEQRARELYGTPDQGATK
jgi:hypothetical protein